MESCKRSTLIHHWFPWFPVLPHPLLRHLGKQRTVTWSRYQPSRTTRPPHRPLPHLHRPPPRQRLRHALGNLALGPRQAATDLRKGTPYSAAGVCGLAPAPPKTEPRGPTSTSARTSLPQSKTSGACIGMRCYLRNLWTLTCSCSRKKMRQIQPPISAAAAGV